MESKFRELGAARRTAAVPLAHLSVELGHLYAVDVVAGGVVAGGVDLPRYFQRIAACAAPDVLAVHAGAPGSRPRTSTCFLVDDYSGPMDSPAALIPRIVAAAAGSGVRIDYLARESGCAEGYPVRLAELVIGQIVDDPPAGTTGGRPPSAQSGWLSNGERGPSGVAVQAMGRVAPWRPPSENSTARDPIFLDVQLWDDTGPTRRYSCSLLSSVWQLLRLGLLRVDGVAPATPVPVDLTDLPRRWSDLPAVARLSPDAAPFFAYRTYSVLDLRFQRVELAVRTILGQIQADPEALAQTALRAAAEKMTLPAELPDRATYHFLGA
jgi:hypothetical protein